MRLVRKVPRLFRIGKSLLPAAEQLENGEKIAQGIKKFSIFTCI